MKKLLQLIVLTVGLATSVGGCGLRQGFQPLPPTFKNWAKEGVSPEGIKVALMECGFDNPYTGFDAHKKVPLNTLVLAELCMEQKGFRYLLENSRACDGKTRSSLPACQRGTAREVVRAGTGQPVTVHNCYGVGDEACQK